MKKKLVAIFVALVMAISLAACGAGEETTLTGMVVSVDGTVISLMEMDAGNMGNFAEGERPEMPEGMEGFEGFEGFEGMEGFEGFEGMEGFEGFEGMEDFNPENFEGNLPQSGGFSPWGNGEMPEGLELPDGMTMPENGQMPSFGGMGGMDFGNLGEDMETQDVDIADAHISVEIEGGKASGSMDDIKAGVFVTITMNGKGQVTNVLVSSQSYFGG